MCRTPHLARICLGTRCMARIIAKCCHLLPAYETPWMKMSFCFPGGFLLPRGFPDSVTDDYITYQLWAFPCHIFVSFGSRLSNACICQAAQF